MDSDTFAISDERPPQKFLSSCLLVAQTEIDEPTRGSTLVVPSRPSLRNVAIVDRTSKIDDAAYHVASSRMSFGGRSASAPDIVLVNEFIADIFLSSLAQYITSPSSSRKVASGSKIPPTSHGNSQRQALEMVKRNHGKRLVLSGINGSVVEIHDR